MKITRRKFLKYSTIALAASATSGLLETPVMAYKPSKIVVENLTYKLKNLPANFDNFTIAQISDLHRGEDVDSTLINKVVAMVNNLKPDLIAITGDCANDNIYLEDCIKSLNSLTAPYGIFSVEGNWEKFYAGKNLKNFYKGSTIQLLANQTKFITIGKKKIVIAGVNDDGGYGKTLKNTFEKVNNNITKILLAHNPYITVHRAKANKAIDLILAGHTHGGQVVYPFLGAVKVPRAFGKVYRAGLFKFTDTSLYVNRGIGVVHIPYRINCPPEITLITLKRT